MTQHADTERCRKCGEPIEGDGFGSPEAGYEHPFSCPQNADLEAAYEDARTRLLDAVRTLAKASEDEGRHAYRGAEARPSSATQMVLDALWCNPELAAPIAARLGALIDGTNS